MRQNVADRIQDAKTEDFEEFLDLMQTDKVQKALGLYLEALKKRE